MIQKLPIHAVLELSRTNPLFDVRSPSEFAHAHIPNAINLPIFTDLQRAEIGTTYKYNSVQDAIKIGLKYFGADLTKYIDRVETSLTSNTDKKVLLHCWRGGMRSAAMAWLLDFYGFEVILLDGGYKAYRQMVLQSFTLPIKFNVLGGYTGSAKTEVLLALKESGEAVIDLEGLASHKGSSFGALGLPTQPTQEQFENNLHKELLEYIRINEHGELHQKNRIWLENESQRIGLVNIPKALFENIIASSLYILQIPFEQRLNFIVEHYGKFTKQELIDAVLRIQKKLGGLETKNVISFLEEDNIFGAFDLLLKYYDRQYLLASRRYKREGKKINAETINIIENAKSILDNSKYYGRI
jgi:tRNA 2-selenouridine synthase